VAHPTDIGWGPSAAIEHLLRAAAELPKETGVVLTGGGFIKLEYPHTGQSLRMIRQAAFLQQLGDWTERELDAALCAIARSKSGRDVVIGVDVFVNGMGSGQFAMWVGRSGRALVAKRFPVNGEDRYLAGFDSTSPLYCQRIVATAVGPTLLLVCHDAQAYNHRNRALVRNASWTTPRARALRELEPLRTTPGLAWALNLVHWVEGERNTRTFSTSYAQMRTDPPSGPPNVAGSFGYEPSMNVMAVAELLERMSSPARNLPKVIFQ
jgi:hypothetical protein